jgi:hypothetical protein
VIHRSPAPSAAGDPTAQITEVDNSVRDFRRSDKIVRHHHAARRKQIIENKEVTGMGPLDELAHRLPFP